MGLATRLVATHAGNSATKLVALFPLGITVGLVLGTAVVVEQGRCCAAVP